MAKGTESMGLKRNKGILHVRCRRCGKKAYHVIHKVCASCNYGKSSRMRKYKWLKKHNSKKRLKGLHYKLRKIS